MATMTDQERLLKTALCDQLMTGGIDGRPDGDAIDRAGQLTDLAIQLERKDGLACAQTWYEALEQRGISGELAIMLDYARANAVAGDRYGTKWHWEQPTLAREIFYLRRAVSHPRFTQMPDKFKCMCLNNLGNRLCVAGRIVEALHSWRRVIEIQPMFGMALCNRARTLAAYAGVLEDNGMRALFWAVAHREASAALSPTALYTDVRDEGNLTMVKALKEWIESAVDILRMKTDAEATAALDSNGWQAACNSKEECDYRHWCLANCLFLNPLNDLGPIAIATDDWLGLPGHIVPVDAPHIFQSFYEQMKQEYVSARWLLYEGCVAKAPHFSDRDVYLQATEPKPSLSLAMEKAKAAYRLSYSLFDKIGFFVNTYMKLGIPERHVSFRTLWRAGENQPIRREFDPTDNWAFCALYWLAKDFFEKENDEVAEPQARGLSDIRNHIEHKYLRVTAADPPAAAPDDLAFMVSREQFEGKAIHLLKLARSALIYLAVGVGFEERRREPSHVGASIEDIPSVSWLPDEEKT